MLNAEFQMPSLSRRRFGAVVGGAVVSMAFGAGCVGRAAQRGNGRLTARVRARTPASVRGTQPLGLPGGRDALLHVPPSAADAALPLLVLLHGAGGRGAGILRRLQPFVNDAGVAVLAPDSRAQTWDVIQGGFGDDVTFINAALERVFDTIAVDPARVSVGGFSDGASYALSLGLVNGDLFGRIVAFSPGFYVGGEVHGRPRVFVSHGRTDEILPIDRCSRVIVPRLRRQGYDVTFRQFDGGHDVPPPIAREGMKLAAG